jgi:hypothetical protein
VSLFTAKQYVNASVNRHTVLYDDGEVEVLDLGKESYRLLATPGKPSASADAGGSAQQDTNNSSIDAAAFMQERNYRVLLDCTSTLALFHPTATRHPHTWHNWSERLLLDVQQNPNKTKDEHYTLLEALGLVKPNAALFMRKVAVMHHRSVGRDNAALLLRALQLLWEGKPLPDTPDQLELLAATAKS